MKRIFYFFILIMAFVACTDDDSFSAAKGLKLEFPADTITLDTVFSLTPSATHSFWVHNRNDKGVRLKSVRLKRGNQTGFRVNVDGIYLDHANGAQANDIEIRKKDSIQVFVEITPHTSYSSVPESVTDQLLFLLENGEEQGVYVQAWAWDAVKCHSSVIEKDSTIESDKPIVIFGDLIVKEGVQLTIQNTTLYFHAGAGLMVHGSLRTNNCILRGDRLDHMFSYLPYDRVPGQWKGVRLFETSDNNVLINTQIRNSVNGLVCDSAAINHMDYRLVMQQCVVHNSQGDGVKLTNAHVRLEDCQLSNAMGHCLSVDGGIVDISYCTLAQFYPFAGGRGAALHFTNLTAPLVALTCQGVIVTGYDEDVLIGEPSSGNNPDFNYSFVRCLLRTPLVEDTGHFNDIIWDDPEAEIQGKKHFVKVDEDNLDYDFHLDSLSTAIGLGCYR